MDDTTKRHRFEEICMPHLDAAHNLARWLTRGSRDAEDVVQEAFLRAFRFLDTFDGREGRVWLLAIVRNTCYTWLEKHRAERSNVEFDEDLLASQGYDVHTLGNDQGYAIDRSLLQTETSARVNRALEQLPAEFREAIVLRELEELPYKEIAAIAGVPIGTVMSRLSRGRKLLLKSLQAAEEL